LGIFSASIVSATLGGTLLACFAQKRQAGELR